MEPCGTPYSNMQTCGQTKLSAVFILLIVPYSFLYFTSQSNKILFLQFSTLFFYIMLQNFRVRNIKVSCPTCKN